VTIDNGRSGADAPSGSQASPGAADASPPSVSIPNAESMIERVAEALANKIAMRKGCPPIRNCLALMPADLAAGFRDDARAAIEAMREPTQAMVDYAWLLIGSNLRYEEVYRKLIDAALSPLVVVEYAEWLERVRSPRAASAMSAGTAETAQQAQGQRPASAVGEAETPTLSQEQP